jgi:hypothetical protein
MLGHSILCSESVVEVNQLTVEGQGGSIVVKFEVDRQQVEGRGIQPGKFEVEDIDDK